MGFIDKFTFGKKQEKLQDGLEKTRSGFLEKVGKALAGKDKIDDEILDDLEEILITSDVGVATTLEVIRRIEQRVARDKYLTTSELNALLQEEITALLKENTPERPAEFDATFDTTPHVIMVVGVNGVGKTTTIGKLAAMYRSAGKKVMLGAGDTFRAGAVEQLRIWSERAQVALIQQGQGADPAAVAYDTVASAQSRQADVVMVDTAGRLHNKKALMQELGKIRRVMGKVVPGAPDRKSVV